MNPPQNGESSRKSPLRSLNGTMNGSGHEASSTSQIDRKMSRLILPEWDVPPMKRVHASHDLISLMGLQPLYEQYAQPYADTAGPDDEGDGAIKSENPPGAGKLPAKKRKLEKGYYGLIDECSDPTPMGESRVQPALSIAALIPEYMGLFGQADGLSDEPPTILPKHIFERALLEPGMQQDGYEMDKDNRVHRKGVRELDNKRKRRREKGLQVDNVVKKTKFGDTSSPLPSPGLPPNPSSPLPPIPPPSHLTRPHPEHIRRSSLPGMPRGGTPYRGGHPSTQRPPSTGLPARPPASISSPSFMGQKRPAPDGGQPGSVKRSKYAPGSRSATPPVNAGSTPLRPGFGKAARSKTEGG